MGHRFRKIQKTNKLMKLIKQFFCRHKWQVISRPVVYLKTEYDNFWSCKERCLKCEKERIYKNYY